MINFWVAYRWLYQFEDVDSYLSASAKPIGKAMQEALAGSDFAEVEKLIMDILRIARISTKYLETAEIYVLCARAKYTMGKMVEVLEPLEKAGKVYKSDPHKYAVIQWMKGCVLWELGGKQVEASQSWQSSLDAFERLRKQYLVQKQAAQWYQQQCVKMRESMRQVNPTQVADARIRQSIFKVIQQILPQDAQIPATPETVQSNQFWINDNIYQLINLGSTTIITVADLPKLFAFWVEDDTMDLAGIMRGDYVLVRWQATATHNSIVAVVIDKIDSHAKLKNFLQVAGEIILRPQSSNPEHQEKRFPGMNQGFHIKGIVLGVFKPV